MFFSLLSYNFIQQTCPDKLHITNFRSFHRETIRLHYGILSNCFFFGNIMGCCTCTSNLRSLGDHFFDGHNGTIKIHSCIWSNFSLFNIFKIRLKGRKYTILVFFKICRRHLKPKLVGLLAKKQIFPADHFL